MSSIGVIAALLALLCWGLGDFLIQRSTRKFGDWIALFYITFFATIVLLPFVIDSLRDLGWVAAELGILLLASVILLFTAIVDFEALRVGKISVIEAVFALEVPVAAALATFVLRERLNLQQTALIAIIVLGIILVTTKSWRHIKRTKLERGVIYAVLATIGMGITNFLVGVGSRATDPLLINWFTSAFVAVFALAVIIAQGRVKMIASDLKQSWKLALSVSIFDNSAWIFFALSATHIPITIATGISESYIALAVGLGILFNRERLRKHQYVGLAITIFAAVALALITKDVL
ncbi:MAG: hypothetical protein ACD_76C00057G0006 [uncultured bacterium]|nr:MAG: hypothetical protein ACD_76C00057G0006 [uncultured bacterium]HBD05656.1 hypothetical protein [Candidatus Uhrbacteria bacterium]